MERKKGIFHELFFIKEKVKVEPDLGLLLAAAVLEWKERNLFS